MKQDCESHVVCIAYTEDIYNMYANRTVNDINIIWFLSLSINQQQPPNVAMCIWCFVFFPPTFSHYSYQIIYVCLLYVSFPCLLLCRQRPGEIK